MCVGVSKWDTDMWESQTAGVGLQAALAASGPNPERLSSRESGVGEQWKRPETQPETRVVGQDSGSEPGQDPTGRSDAPAAMWWPQSQF